METNPEYRPSYTTKALVPYQALTPQAWQMIMEVAPAMHAARYFGVSSPEQAAAIMLKGYELGLSLTASFEFIDDILGHVGLKPRGMLALIHASPLCRSVEVVDQVDDQGQPWACTVTMERTNGFKYSVTVTMDDAHRAGLIKSGSGWEKWPANMLRWRATGFCADVAFPDVGGGMKRTDELGADLTQDGDTIQGDVIDADPWLITVKDLEPIEPKIDMDYLFKYWTTDQIIEANGGQVPGKDQLTAIALELERIDAEKLGGVQ